MKRDLFGTRRLADLCAVAVCMAVAALAQPVAALEAALRDLASQDLSARGRGLTALLQQSPARVQGANGKRLAVLNLIRAYPDQAERIKTTLIAALEQQGAEYERLIKETQNPVDEGFSELWLSLTGAVSALQDPRAVKGLVSSFSAGSTEGLADICPDAVDALIQRIHEPDLYLQGNAVGGRRQAVTALGWCLQRPAMMRANPDVAIKIRRELLTDLGDPDWSIRLHAVDALIPLRTDPEVRAKLQAVAATDPYITADNSPPNRPGARFVVRDGASFILNSDAFSFYVTRTPETRSCHLQSASEPLRGEAVIGPERRSMLQPLMCSQYDPTGQELSLCWRVEPPNACAQ
jgi:hypothetical protein